MQLPTQQQFVADCLSKYRWEPIPSDQQWEAAHFPLPSCSGEHETVKLWSADHTVQGLLQSVELDHPCFHGYRNKHDTGLLTVYYPEYLPLFEQLKSHFNSWHGKKAGAQHAKNKTGVCGRSVEQMTVDGKKGGKISGKKAVELKLGIHGQSAEQMTANGKKGGKISGKKSAELKTGFHAPGIASKGGKKAAELGVGVHAPGMQSAGAKKTSAQQWQCLVTGHISSPGPLARYQKKRGIDTKRRVKIK